MHGVDDQIKLADSASFKTDALPPPLLDGPGRREAAKLRHHLRSQSTRGTFSLRDSVCYDTATSALGASEALYESRYRGIRLNAEGSKRLKAEGASVTTVQAAH